MREMHFFSNDSHDWNDPDYEKYHRKIIWGESSVIAGRRRSSRAGSTASRSSTPSSSSLETSSSSSTTTAFFFPSSRQRWIASPSSSGWSNTAGVHRETDPGCAAGSRRHPPSGTDLSTLAEHYAPDIAAFADLAGFDVSNWPTSRVIAGTLDPGEFAAALADCARLIRPGSAAQSAVPTAAASPSGASGSEPDA